MHPAEFSAQRSPERYLSWNQVRPLVGDIGRTTAWRLERQNLFPKSLSVSPGRRAWRESDILAWQAQRASELEAA